MIIFKEESSNLFLSGEKYSHVGRIKILSKDGFSLFDSTINVNLKIWGLSRRKSLVLHAKRSKDDSSCYILPSEHVWNLISFHYLWTNFLLNAYTPGSGFAQEILVVSSEALHTCIQNDFWTIGTPVSRSLILSYQWVLFPWKTVRKDLIQATLQASESSKILGTHGSQAPF